MNRAGKEVGVQRKVLQLQQRALKVHGSVRSVGVAGAGKNLKEMQVSTKAGRSTERAAAKVGVLTGVPLGPGLPNTVCNLALVSRSPQLWLMPCGLSGFF